MFTGEDLFFSAIIKFFRQKYADLKWHLCKMQQNYDLGNSR